MLKRSRLYPRHIPIVEKLYRKSQQSYETAGGFLPENGESRQNGRVSKVCIRSILEIADPCSNCSKPVHDSFLWMKFHVNICDNCRDDKDVHKLITRTEAKSTYLLKDCDLDVRPPPLMFISRKNPRNSRYGDMKLYLKTQLESRTLQVWGSWLALEEAKEERREKKQQRKDKQFSGKLRDLRKAVRSENKIAKRQATKLHTHVYGDEHWEEQRDQYWKVCSECNFMLTYEKL